MAWLVRWRVLGFYFLLAEEKFAQLELLVVRSFYEDSSFSAFA
jgi:hypothetical protein